ncbi:NUDIX domain-containing protein [Streptomyces sp. NBC_00820]|uniref:nucleotide triphosphate diphosphatase NUDT15 n=1 Tax=Streptomyces sp. NBC_00820 TaxID=2975842 RepID=UPI002ED29268|nr:NUDIX domain-containing protein [Streptomyces sp. NBC_00820]
MTAVVGVGALLFAPDGRILIGRRVKRGESPTWCLPGGHVEPGETFERAAVREIAEETGIAAARVREARVFAVALRTESPDTAVTACVVARAEADVPDGTVAAVVTEPDVFDEWRWVSPEEPPAPLFPATGMLLAAWHGHPAPEGWTVHRVADL